jgi:hypothetical protein
VVGEHRGVVVAEAGDEACRSLDVREEERDRPGEQRASIAVAGHRSTRTACSGECARATPASDAVDCGKVSAAAAAERSTAANSVRRRIISSTSSLGSCSSLCEDSHDGTKMGGTLASGVSLRSPKFREIQEVR